MMRRRDVLWTIVGVLIGAVLVLWWHGHEPSGAELDAIEQRAVGLQAGVLAGDTATVRWPSWTPVPTSTPRVYPTWTPKPTNTPKAYASWTPLPTWTRTTTNTPDRTETVPMTPTAPDKPCEAPWPFTQNERLNIQAAALNHLWMDGRRDEPMVMPQEDALLSIGLYALDLGAPLTEEFRLLADDGGRIQCRGFALGIVALRDGAGGEYSAGECKAWAIVSWGGEARE